jgi:hypothetical protein
VAADPITLEDNMAHGDYNCCARCDSKLSYSSYATTKEEVCADCALDLLELTGERITSGDHLAAWIMRDDVSNAQVVTLGISPCFYGNPVDDAIKHRGIATR